MNYEDPENVEEIIKSIFPLKSIQEIFDLINKIYPTLIKDRLEEFSKDYPHYDINWRSLCATLKIRKAYILLFDEYVEDEKRILQPYF